VDLSYLPQLTGREACEPAEKIFRREKCGSITCCVWDDNQGMCAAVSPDALCYEYAGESSGSTLRVSQSSSLGTDESHAHCISLNPSGNTPDALTITLVWTDAPAAQFSDFTLFNDLDLEVIQSDSPAHYGNDLVSEDERHSRVRRDRVNNAEQVRLEPSLVISSASFAVLEAQVTKARAHWATPGECDADLEWHDSGRSHALGCLPAGGIPDTARIYGRLLGTTGCNAGTLSAEVITTCLVIFLFTQSRIFMQSKHY